jgi:hypothetical protein
MLQSHLSMHGVKRQVDLPRPPNGALIDKHLLEKPHIKQRRQHTRRLVSSQSHAPLEPVLETHKEAVTGLTSTTSQYIRPPPYGSGGI